MGISIGTRIRDLRAKLGLSQAEFGAKCDPPIDKSHICHYETGRQIPSLDVVLPRIARAAGVALAELLEGVEFKPHPHARARSRSVARSA